MRRSEHWPNKNRRRCLMFPMVMFSVCFSSSLTRIHVHQITAVWMFGKYQESPLPIHGKAIKSIIRYLSRMVQYRLDTWPSQAPILFWIPFHCFQRSFCVGVSSTDLHRPINDRNGIHLTALNSTEIPQDTIYALLSPFWAKIPNVTVPG